jgi:hypothetical protein
MITGFWYKVNGARQKTKKTSLVATEITRCGVKAIGVVIYTGCGL